MDTREVGPPSPGFVELVRYLVWPSSRPHGEGPTPLIVAAAAADLTLVRFLLARGADVNARGDYDTTALLAAVNPGWDAEYPEGKGWLRRTRRLPVYDVLRTLLDHGADINARDYEGCTALAYVARLHDSRCERLVLDRHPDVTLKTRFDNTALYYAVDEGRLELARAEMDRGASPNDRNSRHNFSYLMVAAANHDIPMVRLLLSLGADVNAEDDGQFYGTALIGAVNPNAPNTPRHCPVQLLRLLVDHGARVSPKDIRGWTALDYAIENRDEPATRFLRDRLRRERKGRPRSAN